eukprot:755138-Hanusia_phi.AAC.1
MGRGGHSSRPRGWGGPTTMGRTTGPFTRHKCSSTPPQTRPPFWGCYLQEKPYRRIGGRSLITEDISK